MMRIALITDGIDDEWPGVGTYARGLVRGIEAIGGAELTLVHRKPHSFYERRRDIIVPAGRAPGMRAAIDLPRALSRGGFDVVHDAYHMPPFARPSQPFARVITVHDLAPLDLPRSYTTTKMVLWHRHALRAMARRADRIVTDSHYSKRRIIEHYGLAPERVVVAHLAVEPEFKPVTDHESLRRVRAAYALPERYILHVGRLEPRKNLVRLVEAFSSIAGRHDVALVLAGLPTKRGAELDAAIARSGVAHRIVRPGRVPFGDLPALYSMAEAFVFPSLYEGFGIPPLEAMACGAPVIASDATSVPESTGNAALLVDPQSTSAIAESIDRVLGDASLWRALVDMGAEHARAFTWERCARRTLEAYAEALEVRRLGRSAYAASASSAQTTR